MMTRPAALGLASLSMALAAAFGWQQTTADLRSLSTPSTSAESIARSSGETTVDGGTVFRTRGCGGCHAAPGWKPAPSMGFPDLSDARSWAKDRRPGLTARDYLVESIRFPDAFLSPAYTGSGRSPMPSLQLSERELGAVVDYLLTG